MDINQLVILAKEGDAEAFGLIYDQFVQRIFKFVSLKIQNRQEAEDIVQETFVKAYKGLGGLKMQNLNLLFIHTCYGIAQGFIWQAMDRIHAPFKVI